MPNDTGLTGQETATIDRASKWVVINDTQPDALRSFIVSSMSDLALAERISRLNGEQLSALLSELRQRRINLSPA